MRRGRLVAVTQVELFAIAHAKATALAASYRAAESMLVLLAIMPSPALDDEVVATALEFAALTHALTSLEVCAKSMTSDIKIGEPVHFVSEADGSPLRVNLVGELRPGLIAVLDYFFVPARENRAGTSYLPALIDVSE